jgi:hypothetical protein
VEKVRASGVYLVGRLVVMEDPLLASKRPKLAIRTAGGGVWLNSAGLGWANPYDQRVWKYNVDIAVAAANAGFDEIQFDYIRFPTDGNIDSAVYTGKRAEKRHVTIGRFLEYARSRLEPLGVRMSADVFGLSATRNMGIGQNPRRLGRYLDAVYPMVYPSHYGPGELGIADPNAQPGRTVALSLRDFAASRSWPPATRPPTATCSGTRPASTRGECSPRRSDAAFYTAFHTASEQCGNCGKMDFSQIA